jgi:hypothetical protein
VRSEKDAFSNRLSKDPAPAFLNGYPYQKKSRTFLNDKAAIPTSRWQPWTRMQWTKFCTWREQMNQSN